MGSLRAEKGPSQGLGICPCLENPTGRAPHQREGWVSRPPKIGPSRGKVKAKQWLSTAGQWGSSGSGSAVLRPEKKRTG